MDVSIQLLLSQGWRQAVILIVSVAGALVTNEAGDAPATTENAPAVAAVLVAVAVSRLQPFLQRTEKIAIARQLLFTRRRRFATR